MEKCRNFIWYLFEKGEKFEKKHHIVCNRGTNERQRKRDDVWAAKRERERERERESRSNAVFIVFFQSRVGEEEEEEEEGFPTMKRKGFTVESRVKRFVLGRAHKATSILKSKTKFHYARAKRAAKRIMGSKRARRAIRATRKYASGTCKKTMAIAKETRTKAVSFVRTKSNQIWTSVRCGVSVASGDDDFDLLFEFVRDQ